MTGTVFILFRALAHLITSSVPCKKIIMEYMPLHCIIPTSIHLQTLMLTMAEWLSQKDTSENPKVWATPVEIIAANHQLSTLKYKFGIMHLYIIING